MITEIPDDNARIVVQWKALRPILVHLESLPYHQASPLLSAFQASAHVLDEERPMCESEGHIQEPKQCKTNSS